MNKSKKGDLLLSLPFDQYSRQKIAFELIQALRKPNQKFKVLDVGGYKGATSIFQTEDHVTVLDLFDVKEDGYIKGDATNMTFEDGDFDFVVSFDVLEHVPMELRDKFIQECSRVAKIGVLVASPIRTKENEDAEYFLNEIYKELHGKDHIWLKEHIDNIIPEPYYSSEKLSEMGLFTETITSNYTPYWIQMQLAIFAASKFDTYGKNIEKLYEFYNESFNHDGSDKTEENYRLVTIGLKNKQDFIKIQNYKNHQAKEFDKFRKTGELNKRVGSLYIQGTDALFIKLNKISKEHEDNKNKYEADVKRLDGEVEYLKKQNYEILNSKSFKLSKKISTAAHPIKKIRSK